jgi:hypothetical protein
MQVNLDIADIVIKHNLNKAKNSLDKQTGRDPIGPMIVDGIP